MTEKKASEASFSFGRNWRAFLARSTSENLLVAKNDLLEWLDIEMVRGKRVLDIGCGSGIHSLGFWNLGASEVLSIDSDPHSVAATKTLWEDSKKPGNWGIRQHSILDRSVIATMQKNPFDIVYAWGVLHHTGDLWQAMKNSCSLVAPGGWLWLALYVKGPRYERDLRLKQKFNRASAFQKKFMIWRYKASTLIKWILFRDWKALKSNVLRKWKILARGMNPRYDIVDWLGGLPYEVASAEEVLTFFRQRGFHLEKIRTANEGGNNIFLFSRPS